MTESSGYESVQVFIGVDVAKDTHHTMTVNRSDKRLSDKALPNDENKLWSQIAYLKQHGQKLLVVYQPTTISVLPVAFARSTTAPGWQYAASPNYLSAKPQPMHVNAAIVAEAVLPDTLRMLKLAYGQFTELSMPCGFNDDLPA
ncbi:IS110 family transposase [Lelliottia sp. WAP21]|uniref:IS110 family transposase n=1 Tax=Lelliottia sp. WAP21 TaxID=2877426 RepID=UPI001E54545A|nr:IS110 family transposase [Lelliottia sp. WAP21]